MKRLFAYLLLFVPVLVNAQDYSEKTFNFSSVSAPTGAFISRSPSSLSGFTTTTGTASTGQSISVSGGALTAAIVVSGTTNYEVSLNLSTGYGASVSLSPSAGVVSATNVFFRIKSSASVGTVNETANLTSTGAATVTTALNGTVSAVPSLSRTPTSITGLNATAGTAGTAQNVTVTFANSVITVTPPANVEVSKDGGSTYSSSQTLSSGSPVTVMARVPASASGGTTISGNIAFSGTNGVTTLNTSVAGFVSSPGTAHYKTLTVPNTSVFNTTQTNFPVYYTFSDNDLKFVANGGYVQNASGYDVYFSSDAAGTSILPFERVAFDGTAGTSQWFVQQTLSASTNNVIYLQFGKTSITTDQSNRTGTWNTGYAGVFHMDNTITAASQTMPDATSNGRDFTTFGTWTSGQQAAGKVGGAIQLLNANSDFLQWASDWSTGTTYTVEGWYNITVANQTSLGLGYYLSGQNINFFSGQARIFNGSSDGIVDNTTTSINTWTHVAFTVNGTSGIAYHNGAQSNTSSTATSLSFNWLGASLSNFTANIKFDEFRISSVVRSADWIATEYLNMNSPGTFYTVGALN